MTSSVKITTRYSSHDESTVRFFAELKNELGIDSALKTTSIVRSIFIELCKSLSNHQVSNLLQKLPDTFRLLVASDWHSHNKQPETIHLDELADRMYLLTDSTDKKLFSTEIEALNTVLQVFKKLDKFYGFFDFNVLHYTITEEIRQAAKLEDAA